MKWLVLLMIGLTVAIPTAMAQVPDVPQVIETKGQNYDLVEDYFTGIATWQSHPERIFNGSEWADFIVYDRSSFVQVESESIGSLIYDKNSCSYTIYETGKITPNETPLIPSVSWYPRMAQVGTDDYIGLDDLYNQQCDVQVTQGENWVNIKSVKTQTEDLDPVVIQHANGTQSVYPSGTRDVAVLTQTLQISTERGIKETVSVFNGNPEWNNHKMAITQTVHTPDVITLGGNDYNISSMNGQTLDKQWIINNEAEIFQIADSLNYDFDVGINELNAIAFVSDGGLFGSTQKIAMDFSVNDATPYLSSYTVDPTFTSTASLATINTSLTTSGSSCPSPNSVSSTSFTIKLAQSSSVGSECSRADATWDITSLPSGIQVTDVSIEYDVSSIHGNGGIPSMDWTELLVKPDTQSTQDRWDEVNDNTVYVSSDTNSATVSNGYTKDLGSSADSNLTTRIQNGDGWFGVGGKPTSEVRTSTPTQASTLSNIELTVTYWIPTQPSSPTNLSATSGQPIELSWTASSDLGGAQTSDMTYKVERSTYEFAESPLPINAGSDSAVDMSTNKLLYHLDEMATSPNNHIEDTSGQNNDSENLTTEITLNTIADGTGYGVTTGVFSNGGAGSGTLGNAWNFDGLNDYVQLGGTASDWAFLSNGSTAWTISFWFNDNVSTQNSRFFSTMNDNSGSNRGISITHDGTAWGLAVYDGTASAGYPFSTNYSGAFSDTNTWHHYTIVYDNGGANTGTAKLYKDGSLLTTFTQGRAFSSSDPNHAPLIGKRADNARWVDGEIDQFIIWSKELSADQVSALYSSNTIPHASDIKAYYNFEDTGSTLTNETSVSSTSLPTFSTGTIANQIDSPQLTVKSSTLFDGTDAHSVAGWTKAVSSAIGTLFSFENTSGDTISYEIETDKVRVKKGTTTIIEATGQTISTTTPSHVMFTRDASNGWEIFLDGTSIQTATDSTSLGTATTFSQTPYSLDVVSTYHSSTLYTTISSGWAGNEVLSGSSLIGKSIDSVMYRFWQLGTGNSNSPVVKIYDSSGTQKGTDFTTTTTYSDIETSTSNTPTNITFTSSNPVTIAQGDTIRVYADNYGSASLKIVRKDSASSDVSTYGLQFNSGGSPTSTIILPSILSSPQFSSPPTYFIGSSPSGTNVLPSLDEFAIWTSDKGSEASDIYDRGANTFSVVGTTNGSTVTFSDNNSLVSGDTYYHRIIANNGAFDSDPSNVSSSTAGTPPDSPTITSIAINDPNASPLDITLQWQNGASMGSGTFQNYVITRSADSSFTTVQTVANPTTTTYTDTVPNAGTWYYKVATTSTHGTSPNSSASNISTPTEPLPITDLAGQADSDVQTSFSWTQPSTGGSNIVQYKLFRDSINIANTTSTSYTDTGLTQNTSYLYNVFSQNNVGTSTKSNDLTLTTHTPVSGNIGGSANTIGATTKLDVTVNITGGSPTPTFSTFTIKEGSTTIATFTGTTYYLQLDDSDSHNYTVESTDSNHWNNPTITGSFTAQADYEPVWDEGLSYDFVRANGTGTLFVNRDVQGWDINCQYRTTAEVMSNSTGITTSASNQWAYYDTQSVNDVDTLYLECTSNNETLFTDTTFAENRIGGGILLLDNVFSDWVGGVPIAMIFVIFVASLFTGRSSPTGILLIVAMVGVMGAIGLFAIDQAIWSLVLLASVLGIFVGKRFL